MRHARQPGQWDREAQLHPVPLIRRAPHQRHRADKDKQRLLPLSRRKDASSAPADSRIGDMVAAPKSRATSRAWPPDDCRLGPWPRARTGRDVLRRPRLAFPNPRRDRRPLTHPKSVELAKCDNRPAVSTANRTGRITGMLDRAENVQESEDEQDGLEHDHDDVRQRHVRVEQDAAVPARVVVYVGPACRRLWVPFGMPTVHARRGCEPTPVIQR